MAAAAAAPGMSFLSRLREALREAWMSDSHAETITVAASALLVYLAAVAIVRIGKKRFLGRNSVMDLIMGFILGSTLSRAINGNAVLVPTILAGLVLVGVHWFFSMLAARSSRLGLLVKGGHDVVVQDGKYVEHNMRRHHITQNDIREAARMHGLGEIEDIQQAVFERNGEISIVPRFRMQVVDVDVAEGVQKVSIKVYV